MFMLIENQTLTQEKRNHFQITIEVIFKFE